MTTATPNPKHTLMSQFGLPDPNDNVWKNELNEQAYRIGNGNEALRRINEASDG